MIKFFDENGKSVLDEEADTLEKNMKKFSENLEEAKADTKQSTNIINNIVKDQKSNIEDNLSKVQEVAITDFHKNGVSAISAKVASGEMSLADAGKDLAALKASVDAMSPDEENADFVKKMKEKKQQEIEAYLSSAAAREEAKEIAAKQMKAEQFYIAYRPILEMDLSPFLKKRKKTITREKKFNTKTGRKEWVDLTDEEIQKRSIEAQEIEDKPKTYADRSYGIPLMIILLCFLTVPYILAALVLSIFNIISAIFDATATFSKPAFIICAGMAAIVLVGLFVWVVWAAASGLIPSIPAPWKLG